MPTKVRLVDSKGNPYLFEIDGNTTQEDILAAAGAEVGAKLLLQVPLDRTLNEFGVKTGEVRDITILPGSSFLRRR